MTLSPIWQARLSPEDSERYDAARNALGLTRSDALRHVLPFLEHEARQKRLADDYDECYGTDSYPVENVHSA